MVAAYVSAFFLSNLQEKFLRFCFCLSDNFYSYYSKFLLTTEMVNWLLVIEFALRTKKSHNSKQKKNKN